MRIDRKAKEYATNLVRENPSIKQDEIIERVVRQVFPRPDLKELETQWEKRMAGQVVSWCKDARNIRVAYAAKNEFGETVYENTELSKNIERLNNIGNVLHKRAKKLIQSTRKVKRQEKKVIEELDMFAAMEEAKSIKKSGESKQ
ncbi:hypothetical protein Ga0466249_002878 [Sporomusaceae bacterium BoRhaA]|uniref:hypothetical protein n=1 Tax=Pelorhabdus rhamnosifermentans TaxID=2772457 RepID=UPI001C060F4B|nr:hypothetical protein [Pelorhabdus rhamnosifermentans]MBU2701759.1 hypothetical protein [Pelorhabdus rhamnosifermentans]